MNGIKVMKRSIKTVLGILISVLLIVPLNGCKKESDNSVEPAKYHKFKIYNHTYYTHNQLTKLNVTPVNGGSTLSADFVINYVDTRDVPIPIPETNIYKIELFSSDGQSMWWNGIALELPGNSTIDIKADSYPVRFWGVYGGIDNSGTDMTP